MLSYTGHSQTVFTFYKGIVDPYPPQRDSHPNRLLCAEPFVLAGSHVGGTFYHLLPEHRVGRPDVHVSFESTTADCEWAPRLNKDRGEMGVISEGSLG